jgi:hypothetical protein
MKIGAEDIESIKLYDWIIYNNLDDVSFHVGNERRVSPQAGAIFKRKGIKPGVSDYFIMKARNGFHGLIIELKVKGGKVSPAQKEFLEVMNREGYLALVAWSAEEAISVINDYLGIGVLLSEINMPPNCS